MTGQAEFWAGKFGEEYIERNSSPALLSGNLALFVEVLSAAGTKPNTVFEVGTNVGLNLDALKLLAPGVQTYGLEVNPRAAEIASSKGHNVRSVSLEEFSPELQYDLVISKGVLIHLDPSSLSRAYEVLARSAGRFVLLAEYFSAQPTEVEYRGFKEKLFKRDFVREFLASHPDFSLRSFGFRSSLGVFPQDDFNWYLLERTAARSKASEG